MSFSKQLEKKLDGRVLAVSIVSTIVYIILFRVIYVEYLYPLFGYIGYKYNIATEYEETLSNILAFLPILFYRARKVPSDLIAILTFILIHIPTVITLQYHFKDYNSIIVYQVAFTFAQTLFFLASWNKLGEERCEKYTDSISIKFLIVVGMLILIVLIAFFGDQLRFVSFSDIYKLRSDNDRFSRGYKLIGYFTNWAAFFFAPFFIAYGCLKKKYWICLIGCLCSLVVYMASGSKSAILMPFAVFPIYFLMANKKMKSIVYFFPIVTMGVLLLFLLVLFVDNKLFYFVGTVLFMRTLGVAGWLASGYITVFNSYPYTYYSHIGIVNYFTGMYPFHNPSLGNAVWTIYRGRGVHTNANANFLLTDGFAALGIPGILLIAAFFYCVLIYTNRISNNHNIPFVMATLAGAILSFTNVSLFTTFLSSGFIFCILLFRFTKTREKEAEC